MSADEPESTAEPESTDGPAPPDDRRSQGAASDGQESDERSTTNGGALTRRGAMAALGLTGLLGLGVSTAGASPRGQVGTASSPVSTVHARTVHSDGSLSIETGTDDAGNVIAGHATNEAGAGVVGAAIGYQMFWNDERTQVILETGGQLGTRDTTRDEAAVGARFQQAIGDRFVLRLDGFVSAEESGDAGYGARTEFVTQF